VKNLMIISGISALLIFPPLLGAFLSGQPILQYTEFPPTTVYVQHADFSPAHFAILAVLITIALLPFIIRILTSQDSAALPNAETPNKIFSFPWWGWIAIIVNICSWIIAWNNFEWTHYLKRFTFSFLWISYTVIINAITFKRTGRSILTHQPTYFLMLFIASAVFWWFFEYLNRFVQNWYYEGVENMSSFEYFLFATLPFSTVLPAVMSTCALLETYPRLSAGLDHFIRINMKHTRIAGCVSLLMFTASLAGIALFPDYLFPMLWIAPLFIITSLRAMLGKTTLFTSLKHGYWQRIFLLSLAGVMCGFFWEMWNFYSMPKWKYSVPFVQKFHLFEMPLLGYAGYIPFGWECAVIADAVLDMTRKWRRAHPSTRTR